MQAWNRLIAFLFQFKLRKINQYNKHADLGVAKASSSTGDVREKNREQGKLQFAKKQVKRKLVKISAFLC